MTELAALHRERNEQRATINALQARLLESHASQAALHDAVIEMDRLLRQASGQPGCPTAAAPALQQEIAAAAMSTAFSAALQHPQLQTLQTMQHRGLAAAERAALAQQAHRGPSEAAPRPPQQVKSDADGMLAAALAAPQALEKQGSTTLAASTHLSDAACSASSSTSSTSSLSDVTPSQLSPTGARSSPDQSLWIERAPSQPKSVPASAAHEGAVPCAAAPTAAPQPANMLELLCSVANAHDGDPGYKTPPANECGRSTGSPPNDTSKPPAMRPTAASPPRDATSLLAQARGGLGAAGSLARIRQQSAMAANASGCLGAGGGVPPWSPKRQKLHADGSSGQGC